MIFQNFDELLGSVMNKVIDNVAKVSAKSNCMTILLL